MVDSSGGTYKNTPTFKSKEGLRGEMCKRKDLIIPSGLGPSFLLGFLSVDRGIHGEFLLNVADMVGTPRILVVSISGRTYHYYMRYLRDMSQLIEKGNNYKGEAM